MSDLLLDGDGVAHVLIKAFDDPVDPNRATLEYRVKPDAASPWSAPETLGTGCAWARFVPVAEAAPPLVACSGFASLHLRTLDGLAEVELRLPPRLVGAYLYVAAPRSGTAVDEPPIDLLLIAGTPSSYPHGSALLATLPRAALAALTGEGP